MAQANDFQIIEKKLNVYLDTIEKKNFSGSVLIEYKGKIILSKGYGESDRDQGIQNTSTTVYDIGSVTKQFTAAAILKLEMEKKLKVNDKISKYINNIPNDKVDITIHNLLTHTSGLIDQIGVDYDVITESDYLEKLMSEELLFNVGEKFDYSDSNYSLLALIIERASGLPYENYLYQNLFLPSGMENTGYTRPKFKQHDIAVGYKHDSFWGKPTDKKWDVDAPYANLKGAGAILSTVEDLYKWHRALLRNDILSLEAKNKLFNTNVQDGDQQIFYGYGWFLGNMDYSDSKPKNLINHNGGNHVFFCDFWRFMDEDLTIIIQSNNYDNYTGWITSQLAKLIFKPDYKPYEKNNYREIHQLFMNGMNASEVVSIILKENENKYKSEYDLSEVSLNDVGYDLIEEKRNKDALAIFKVNSELYPNSSNAYDSYGESLLAIGNVKDGINAYKKSLELDPQNYNAKKIILKYESP